MSAASIGVGVKTHNDLMIFGGAVGLGTTAVAGGVVAYKGSAMDFAARSGEEDFFGFDYSGGPHEVRDSLNSQYASLPARTEEELTLEFEAHKKAPLVALFLEKAYEEAFQEGKIQRGQYKIPVKKNIAPQEEYDEYSATQEDKIVTQKEYAEYYVRRNFIALKAKPMQILRPSLMLDPNQMSIMISLRILNFTYEK